MAEAKTGALAPVTRIRGVGEKRAESFAKLGAKTVGELVYHFPRGYENRGNIKNVEEVEDGELCALVLCVAAASRPVMIRRGMTLTKVAAFDDTGKCNITFFNQPYVRDVLREGAYFRFYGRVEKKGKAVSMASPAFEPVVPQKPLRALVPVYPLAVGLTQKFLSGAMKEALAIALTGEGALREYLPTEIRKKYELAELSYALRSIHEPQTSLDAERARKRLAFDEIYLFALQMLREGKKEKEPSRFAFKKPDRGAFLSLFPYPPPGAQKRTFDELDADMTSG